MLPASLLGQGMQLVQSIDTPRPPSLVAITNGFAAFTVLSNAGCVYLLVQEHAQPLRYQEDLFVLDGHESEVTALTFSASSQLLCTCSREYIIWYSMQDVVSDLLCQRKSCGRTLSLATLLSSLQISLCPNMAMSMAGSATWNDTDPLALDATHPAFPPTGISSAALPSHYCLFDASEKMTALCIADKVLVVVVETGQLYAVLEGHTGRVNQVAFCCHKPHWLISISDDRTFKVWDLAERQLLYQSAVVSSSPFVCLALDPVLPRFVVGADDGKIRFYDLANPGCRCLTAIDVPACVRKEEQKQQVVSSAIPSPAHVVISAKKTLATKT